MILRTLSFALLLCALALRVPTAAATEGEYRDPAALLLAAQSRYEAIAKNGGWPAFEKGKPIKPGMSDARIATVRAILSATGDLQPQQQEMRQAMEENDAAMYDDVLQAAVERFQARHALKADGTIGRDTQEALAVPVEQRIAQIQATLERVHDTQPQGDERYILVNVPGFYLQAIENQKVAMTSRVIVGSPANATPLFSKEITDVNFNPSWHVPARIAAQELAAKERKNPGYLARSGFVLTDSDGSALSPDEVDWSQAHAYRFRQPPGAGNALGNIKFNLPNRYNVYLHGTSSPKLFDKDYRALSHGCIRVEQTKDLAHFVIKDVEHWGEEQIDRAYRGSASRTVRLDTPVPVYLVYWPVWVDASETVHFHPDIYKKQAARVAELMRGSEFTLAEK